MSWTHWIEEEAKVGENLLEKVEYLIKRDNLKDNCRKRYLVDKRNYLYFKLREEGYSCVFVGRLFDRHHATIIHGTRAHENVQNNKDVEHTLKEYKQIIEK